MREIPEGISDADLIRRLKDKISGHKHQIELLKMVNKKNSDMNSKLLESMKRNDLFNSYHKQEDELSK